MKPKFIYRAKSKNRRIDIVIYQEENEEPFFRVITKRLVSFKDRKITSTDNMYSVETMTLLSVLFDSFMEEPTVRKMCNPYSKFDKWKTEILDTTKH